MSDLLVIPSEGLMHLFASETDFSDSVIEMSLRAHCDDGVYSTLNTEGHPYLISMLLHEGHPPNPRAAAAFHNLFGLHMIFTGPVGFSGLTHEESRDLLIVLS